MTHSRYARALGVLAAVFVTTAGLAASTGRFATLEERLIGADAVVVATARSVTSEWRENRFGDRLIVSRVELEVDEALKGSPSRTMWLELEGGTLDGFTLSVSSLPSIRGGERAVFFLDQPSRGVSTLHLRGQGVLFLDDDDVVRGSSLRLNDIRVQARSLGK